MIGSYRSDMDEIHAAARSNRFYDDAKVEQLAIDFRIPSDLLETLSGGLQWSAERWYVRKRHPVVDASATRSALQGMKKRIDVAVEAMKEVPPESWSHVAEASYWLRPSPAEYAVSSSADEEPGIQIVDLKVEYGLDGRPHSAPLAEIVEMLEAISEHAAVADGIVREFHGKPGPKRDHAFNEWMVSIRYVWTRSLARDFTYDAEAGTAISEAARFAVAAFKLLEPSLSEDEVRRKVRNFWDFDRKVKNLRS